MLDTRHDWEQWDAEIRNTAWGREWFREALAGETVEAYFQALWIWADDDVLEMLGSYLFGMVDTRQGAYGLSPLATATLLDLVRQEHDRRNALYR